MNDGPVMLEERPERIPWWVLAMSALIGLTFCALIGSLVYAIIRMSVTPEPGHRAATLEFATEAERLFPIATNFPTQTEFPTQTKFGQVCDCSDDRFNCPDFGSHEAAQSCFDFCLPRYGDVHNLDRDNDGLVCEDR